MKILFIALRTLQNKERGYFQLGLAYLVSSLRRIDIEPDVLLCDVYNYDDQYIWRYLRKKHYDLIGIGFLYDNIRETIKMAELIRSASPEPKILIGGAGPSSCPEFMLNKINPDFLAMGEAEITIQLLAKAIMNHSSLDEVPGIYYRTGNQYINTGSAKIIDDLSDCPLPAWDKFPMEYYIKSVRSPATIKDRYMCMITSRGCPYNCNFCFCTDKYRIRKVEDVVLEIKELKDRYKINFIQFYDDLFMISKKRTLELCQAFIDKGLNIKYRILGRVNIVDEEQILALKESGCVAIGYGIESGDQQVLDRMNKRITIEQILHAIDITKKAGICVTTPVMFGQPGENKETLGKTKELLIKITDDHEPNRRIRPLTPYPGTPIYKWAMENGYIKNAEDFFQRFTRAETLSVNLTELSDEEFMHELNVANKEIKNHYVNIGAAIPKPSSYSEKQEIGTLSQIYRYCRRQASRFIKPFRRAMK